MRFSEFPVDPSIYKPSKWGMRYHNLETIEALGAGSAGPGKSMVLLMDPFTQIAIENERCLHPDRPNPQLPSKLQEKWPLRWGESKGWALHLRRTMPRLLQTLARAHVIFRKIEPDVRWNSKDQVFTFKCGYKVQFGHCRNPGDWHLYTSQEYSHIGIDELIEFIEEQVHWIMSRRRSSDDIMDSMSCFRAMTNPVVSEDVSGIKLGDTEWVRRRYVDPFPQGNKVLSKTERAHDGRLVKRTRIYLPATLYDNPDERFVRSYEDELLHKPKHIRQALLYGDWYWTVGGFYSDDWDPDIHVCKPFRIPETWKVFRALDWGYRKPGCVHWYAIDSDDVLYQIKELTFQDKSDVQMAIRIRDEDRKMGFVRNNVSLLNGPSDIQLWEERGEAVCSKADTMAKHGVQWVKANKKSRGRNAELLLDRLKDTDSDGKNPGFVVFDTCQKTIQIIPSVKTHKENPNVPADSKNDHWHDNVLYACAYASLPGVGTSLSDVREWGSEPDVGEENGQGYGYGFRYN